MLHGVGVRACQGWAERAGALAGPAVIRLEARGPSSESYQRLPFLGDRPLHADTRVRAPGSNRTSPSLIRNFRYFAGER